MTARVVPGRWDRLMLRQGYLLRCTAPGPILAPVYVAAAAFGKKPLLTMGGAPHGRGGHDERRIWGSGNWQL